MEHSLQRLFHPLLLTRPEPFDKAEGASAPAGLLECPRVHATRPLASRACRISPARSVAASAVFTQPASSPSDSSSSRFGRASSRSRARVLSANQLRL